MASVNFEKFKSVTQTKAVMRHCDREERIKTKHHSNDSINVQATERNTQIRNRDYNATCQRFDERLAFLDKQPGANKRKDRVVCFGLNIPAPNGMDTKTASEWFNKAYKAICMQYGKQNVMNVYTHRDEQHEYIDSESNERRMSREHMHVIIIPEHDGKLNGKWFSSRRNMMRLNNTLHEMTENDYGLPFMDGSKKKSSKSVEALKRRSEALQAEEQVKALEERVKALESEIEGLESRRAELLRLEEEGTGIFGRYKAKVAEDLALEISKRVEGTERSTTPSAIKRNLDKSFARAQQAVAIVDYSNQDDREFDDTP